MRIEHVFPVLMAVLPLGAASVYTYQQNWQLALYWFLVSAINGVVSTFK